MALIPPIYMDSVVAIGTIRDVEHLWVATGFFYGDAITSDIDSLFQVFLVTNRHGLMDLSPISLRFNPQDGPSATEVDLVDVEERVSFHPNPNVDLAVLPIEVEYFRDMGLRLEFFQSPQAATLSKMSEIGITEGDGVFVMGFPMGLVGSERSAVIVRSGSIARVQDAYAGYQDHFLIASSVFPGNSGGPVIAKPEAMAIEGTASNQRSLLLGIVSAYIPYTETAVSQQTGLIRAVFTENSGLAQILPMNLVNETIAHAIERLPDLQERRLESGPTNPTDL